MNGFFREMSLSPKRMHCYYAFLGVYVVFQIIFLSILRSHNRDTHSNAVKVLEIYKELSMRLNGNAEMDNSGLYKIVNLKKLKDTSVVDITLVSQCSSNHFPAVDKLFNSWKGPISIAVFSEVENIEQTLWDSAKLLHCFSFRDFAFHLVAPTHEKYVKDFKFGNEMMSESDKSISCDSAFVSYKKRSMRNYNWTIPYPVNLLRNTAKSASSTDYILVIDVDMTPSPNLREDFLNFTRSQPPRTEKVVYVVPIFETHSDVRIPRDKTELMKVVKLNQARPFYVVPCQNCQKLTNYYEWLAQDKTSGVRVLYEVEWKHPWEPFFIARRDMPNFDERFKQYGMNRVSQICELHIAGYKFLVLDNVFLVHKGYKTLEGFHPSKTKEMEQNRRLYSRFKVEVKYKYPYSERNC